MCQGIQKAKLTWAICVATIDKSVQFISNVILLDIVIAIPLWK